MQAYFRVPGPLYASLTASVCSGLKAGHDGADGVGLIRDDEHDVVVTLAASGLGAGESRGYRVRDVEVCDNAGYHAFSPANLVENRGELLAAFDRFARRRIVDFLDFFDRGYVRDYGGSGKSGFRGESDELAHGAGVEAGEGQGERGVGFHTNLLGAMPLNTSLSYDELCLTLASLGLIEPDCQAYFFGWPEPFWPPSQTTLQIRCQLWLSTGFPQGYIFLLEVIFFCYFCLPIQFLLSPWLR